MNQHHSRKINSQAISHATKDDAARKSEHEYIQKQKKKWRKARRQQQKADAHLQNRIRQQNDRFIRNWSPGNTPDPVQAASIFSAAQQEPSGKHQK